MSRHRNVRGLNLDDEVDDYDAYGHSIDDDYCISPGTAAQFTFNRDEGMTVSSFMHGKIAEEENESDEEDMIDGHDRSGSFSRPQLSDTDQARLNSCLDELHNILGEAYSETVLIRTTMSNDYNVERVLNQLLEPEDVPKPQRQPRQNRRTQGEDENEDDSGDESVLDGVSFFNSPIVYINCPSGRLKFGEPESPYSDCKLLTIDVICSNTNQNVISDLADKENIPSRINISSQCSSPVYLASKSTRHQSKYLKSKTDVKTVLSESVSEDLKTTETSHASDLDFDSNIHQIDPSAEPYEDKNRPQNAFVFKSPLSHLKEKSLEIKNKKLSAVSPLTQKTSSVPLLSTSPFPNKLYLKSQEPIFSLNGLIKKHGSNQNLPYISNTADTEISSVPPPVLLSMTRVNDGNDNHPYLKRGKGEDSLLDNKLDSGVDTKPEKQLISFFSLISHHASVSNVYALPEVKLSLSELVSQHEHSSTQIGPPMSHAVASAQNSSSPVGMSLSALAQQHKALHVNSVIASVNVNRQSDKLNTLGNVEVSSSKTDLVSLSELIKTHSSSKQTTDTEEHGGVSSPKKDSSLADFAKIFSTGVQGAGLKQTNVHNSQSPGQINLMSAISDKPKSAGLPAGFDLTQLLSLNVKMSTLSSAGLNGSSSTCSTENPSKTADDIAQILSRPLSPFDQPTSTDAFIQKYQRPSTVFGKVLSLRLHNLDENKLLSSHDSKLTSLKFHQFCYSVQKGCDPAEEKIVLHNVTPFNFMTSSPDDIANQKQQEAFKTTTISNGPEPSILNTPPKVVKSSNGVSSPGRLASDVKHLDMSDERPRQNKQKLNAGMALMAGKSGSSSSESGRKPKKSRAELMGVDKVPESEFLSTPKKELDPERASAGAIPKSASKARQDPAKILEEYKKRQDGKQLINMVVIGHVDAGKSTLMGHLLYQLGSVNKKTMHKYETESRKLGKSSFAYAWVLDETEEERSRGVTMDVAQTHFQTEHKLVTLLDAPGHKDFIPNMITGAAQADVAILVVNATRGEFETGFEAGGQTREHALLARSLGVSQLAVAINKMDTVEWSADRYNDITKKLGLFLKQAGFKEADVSYIPCSGLMGENLTESARDPRLTAWYQGPYLLHQIDKFRPPERAIDKPMRLSVSDIYKGMGSGFVVAGKMESGVVQISDKIVVMPSGDTGVVKVEQGLRIFPHCEQQNKVVKGIFSDDGQTTYAFAGDHVQVTLTGVEISHVAVGNIVCDPSNPIRSSTRIRARIVVFNIAIPLTRGYPVVFHYQSLSEPAVIRRLVSTLNKTTGEILKAKPKCLTKNSNAVVELELEKPVCIELYKEFKDLGRFMLRSGGSTIAAGLVEEILVSKSSRDEQ